MILEQIVREILETDVYDIVRVGIFIQRIYVTGWYKQAE